MLEICPVGRIYMGIFLLLLISTSRLSTSTQNVYAPEDDPEMKVEHYQRTEEQDEELGLDQMKVD